MMDFVDCIIRPRSNEVMRRWTDPECRGTPDVGSVPSYEDGEWANRELGLGVNNVGGASVCSVRELTRGDDRVEGTGWEDAIWAVH